MRPVAPRRSSRIAWIALADAARPAVGDQDGYLAWAHELDCFPLWMVVVVEHVKDIEACTCRYVAQGDATLTMRLSSVRSGAKLTGKGFRSPCLNGCVVDLAVLALPSSGWVSA